RTVHDHGLSTWYNTLCLIFSLLTYFIFFFFFFFQAEDGIRDPLVTGVQTCALPIFPLPSPDCAPMRGPVITARDRRHRILWIGRSEERRVGKECRSRWWRCH